jgi:hypothetical protein
MAFPVMMRLSQALWHLVAPRLEMCVHDNTIWRKPEAAQA